ncbi:MAG: hypothetical protein EPO08_20840 [Rhodospirillaceae bacterium]|nr:MAG: hypothetical protein EPO08_20840 [Rhodospirillaceae bacterium]
MNRTTQFVSQVTGGKLENPVARAGIADALKRLEGRKAKVTVEEYKKTRSNNQSRFYRGVIVPAIRDWLIDQGWNLSLDEVHDFLVREVWKFTKYETLPDGTSVEVRKSSTEADTALWEQFQTITRERFARMGLQLPFPHENIGKETGS